MDPKRKFGSAGRCEQPFDFRPLGGVGGEAPQEFCGLAGGVRPFARFQEGDREPKPRLVESWIE